MSKILTIMREWSLDMYVQPYQHCLIPDPEVAEVFRLRDTRLTQVFVSPDLLLKRQLRWRRTFLDCGASWLEQTPDRIFSPILISVVPQPPLNPVSTCSETGP
jgi:hypothetical protein